MAAFTFYQSFFDDLEKFKINAEKGTFNDLTSDKFSEYKKNIEHQYKDFEKELDSIICDDNIPTEKLILSFQVLQTRFNIIKDTTAGLYNNFLSKYKYNIIPWLNGKPPHKELSGIFLTSKTLKDLAYVSGCHINIIDKIDRYIISRLEIIQNQTTASKSNNNTSQATKENNQDTKNVILDFDKIILNIGKEQIALLFVLLKYSKLIEFKTEADMARFLENTFMYRHPFNNDIRKIVKINSEISHVLKDDMPKKSWDELVTKIDNAIHVSKDDIFGYDFL